MSGRRLWHGRHAAGRHDGIWRHALHGGPAVGLLLIRHIAVWHGAILSIRRLHLVVGIGNVGAGAHVAREHLLAHLVVVVVSILAMVVVGARISVGIVVVVRIVTAILVVIMRAAVMAASSASTAIASTAGSSTHAANNIRVDPSPGSTSALVLRTHAIHRDCANCSHCSHCSPLRSPPSRQMTVVHHAGLGMRQSSPTHNSWSLPAADVSRSVDVEKSSSVVRLLGRRRSSESYVDY